MSLKDSWNNPEKLARLEMADAERKAKKAITRESEQNEAPSAPKVPQRYKLYDKIKLKVSLRTMDIIIYTVVALLVICIIVGVATGGSV